MGLCAAIVINLARSGAAFPQRLEIQSKELKFEHRIPLHREETPEQATEVVALLVTSNVMRATLPSTPWTIPRNVDFDSAT